MYSVSNDFLTKVASASRRFVARMTATNGYLMDSDGLYLTDADGYYLVNGVVPVSMDISSDKFISFTLSGGANSEQDFSLGSCVAQCLNVVLNGNELITQGAEYLLEIGLVLDDNSIEYVPMGYFIAQKPTTTENKTTATLYDRMIFTDSVAVDVSELSETTTTLAVLQKLSLSVNIPIDTTGLSAISMARPDSTKSWREILSSVAQLYGGFAVADRSGCICIKKYDFDTTVATIGADRYTEFTRADDNYTLLNLYVVTGYDADGAEIYVTSGTGTGGIVFENADMTQALLNSIYSYYSGMSYMPSEISSMLGRPEIDVWDCIAVTDQNGVAYTVPLMARELSFDGGLTDSISAYGKSEAEQLNAYQSVFESLLKQTSGLLNIVAKKINFAVEGQYLSSTFEISDSAITSITDKFIIKGSDGTTTVISGGEIQANTITADELNVSTLSAISANLGTVTAGTIKSTNYVSGTSGMLLDLSTGAWDSPYFKISSTGEITATGGTLGGWTINEDSISTSYQMWGAGSDVTVELNPASIYTVMQVTLNGNTVFHVGPIGDVNCKSLSVSGTMGATSTIYAGGGISTASTLTATGAISTSSTITADGLITCNAGPMVQYQSTHKRYCTGSNSDVVFYWTGSAFQVYVSDSYVGTLTPA